MPNEIKELFGNVTAFTISLGGLVSSTAGVGRQSTLVANTTTEFSRAHVAASIKQGTSPTGNKAAYLYAIRSNDDTAPIADDGAGASDAGWTALNAEHMVYAGSGRPSILYNKAAPATGDVLSGNFVLWYPGRKFGVGVVHDTVAALDATGSNHVISYFGANPEVQ